MKKFIAGIMVGALLFGGTSVLADSIKSLVGAKVTGTYTVQKTDGTKVADGAVINGSAYVPVRALAEATGIPLNVEGKTITMGTQSVKPEGNALSDEALTLVNEITRLKNVNRSTQELIELELIHEKTLLDSIAKEEAREEELPGSLEILQSNLTKTREKVAEYQAKIDAAEAEITKLQAQVDALSK
ncbi:hypothetical protein [Paenibacillus bouchesdurhonensis]|uniref:hypothetical protein n=1 Tax=Paenibacillus bouchesdurhonensis TaxID=1870990 RepID=UPI000DA6296F|nr:hypothetical protein [Paenibacillus bouchesdurhonensis]